ncbi:hypothetical protein F5Y19DRAFT_472219 [Xylariaceae sp. FL1651]|nr:hypothetical protein F5Y19DRAFT_472219 [Xylariaceae sp. FL1651]
MPTSRLDEDYAPNWLPYFSPQGRLVGTVRLDVECSICGQKLAIMQPPDANYEAFAVLPCGHVFGHNCIKLWFRQNPTCPKCRRNVEHRACGHSVVPQRLEYMNGFNIHQDLPPILGENEELPPYFEKLRRMRVRTRLYRDCRNFPYKMPGPTILLITPVAAAVHNLQQHKVAIVRRHILGQERPRTMGNLRGSADHNAISLRSRQFGREVDRHPDREPPFSVHSLAATGQRATAVSSTRVPPSGPGHTVGWGPGHAFTWHPKEYAGQNEGRVYWEGTRDPGGNEFWEPVPSDAWNPSALWRPGRGPPQRW